ncbi:Neuroblastoma-amplified sequence, partial [Tetrabaena socialis]
DPAAADDLIAAAAAEILAAAADPWDETAQQAAAVLSLASPEAPHAAALRRLTAALQLLPELGLELLPAQVLQMGDRFEVVRLVLEREEAVGAVGAVEAVEGVVREAARGVFGLSLPLGAQGSRRRAAVGAAARAAAAAGGHAAVVAKRFAPVAGMVADAVAAAVTAAAADAAAGGLSYVSSYTAPQPPYKQLGRLLELAELLGMTAPEDELRIRDLAARAALRAGDVAAAQQLTLRLLAAQYQPSWSLCADLGSHRHLPDDTVRQRLLSYALLHCPPYRMAVLLEELLAAERRLAAAAAPAAAPGEEGAEVRLRAALLAAEAPDAAGPGAAGVAAEAAPTARLPWAGDVALALAVLAPGGGGGGEAAAAVAELEGLLGGGGGG